MCLIAGCSEPAAGVFCLAHLDEGRAIDVATELESRRMGE